MRLALGAGLGVVVAWFIFLLIFALVIMFVWNFALVPLLGFQTIDVVIAAAISLGLGILRGVLTGK